MVLGGVFLDSFWEFLDGGGLSTYTHRHITDGDG